VASVAASVALSGSLISECFTGMNSLELSQVSPELGDSNRMTLISSVDRIKSKMRSWQH